MKSGQKRNLYKTVKSIFPKWKLGSLASHIKNLVENGSDLLSKMSAHWQVNCTKQVSGKKTLNHPYFNDLDNQIKKM